MAVIFGRFALDSRAREVRRAGKPVHLSPKAFDLLALLVARRPDAVAKADIHTELWPDTFVSDVNLAVLVAEIRAALGDSARQPRYIRTVQRFGYAFVGTSADVHERATAPRLGTCWVAWRGARTLLTGGENVLGRDPGADVRVDAVGVSRRHAVIVVGDSDVTLYDLSSKNGTYVGDRRITTPVSLSDGSEIRLGPIPMTFHRGSSATSTQTVSHTLR
ncbi:MAG TPA: FHA domain-containing protein [Vicinamibacterales bacterium]|nr:FHA domain-containing protein [Vicinamibacterales bacterium]